MNASGSVDPLTSWQPKANQLTEIQVPQAPSVSIRPLLFGTCQGYFVNILRVKRSGILSRHQHTGLVHATTLKGRWHYLEHDWC
jgi:2,4'-dihydroxyacetophenone dioxygenase